MCVRMLILAAGSRAAVELLNDSCNYGLFRFRGLALNSKPRCEHHELGLITLHQHTGRLGTRQPASITHMRHQKQTRTSEPATHLHPAVTKILVNAVESLSGDALVLARTFACAVDCTRRPRRAVLCDTQVSRLLMAIRVVFRLRTEQQPDVVALHALALEASYPKAITALPPVDPL